MDVHPLEHSITYLSEAARNPEQINLSRFVYRRIKPSKVDHNRKYCARRRLLGMISQQSLREQPSFNLSAMSISACSRNHLAAERSYLLRAVGINSSISYHWEALPCGSPFSDGPCQRIVSRASKIRNTAVSTFTTTGPATQSSCTLQRWPIHALSMYRILPRRHWRSGWQYWRK